MNWSIKSIGKRDDVIKEVDSVVICPMEVKTTVKEVLTRYPEDAQVFVDTGGKLSHSFGTFNLRIEINKNRKMRTEKEAA